MKKVGDTVYWMGARNMAYGIVLKVTPKLYILIEASNYRSQIYHDDIISKEEACKRHLQSARAAFKRAKEWLEHSEKFTKKLLENV